MRALQTRFVTQVLWATMLVVMAGILAGCPEEPLKECIAQVLYLASCGTATVVVKLDFAQGSGYLNDRGLERGLGPMRQWSSRQRDIIILSTLTVDAAILAYDRVEATSRLLLAGILVLWAARYRSSASPSTSMAAMMTGISTAILQTMLWQVGQPVAMLLHASEPSRLRYTLAVTVLPVLRLIDCELIVILVSVIHEAPQWLLVGLSGLIITIMVLIADDDRRLQRHTLPGPNILDARSLSALTSQHWSYLLLVQYQPQHASLSSVLFSTILETADRTGEMAQLRPQRTRFLQSLWQ